MPKKKYFDSEENHSPPPLQTDRRRHSLLPLVEIRHVVHDI